MKPTLRLTVMISNEHGFDATNSNSRQSTSTHSYSLQPI